MTIRLSCLLAAGFSLAGSLAHAEATQYPISIDNCGFTLEFAAAPKNVVSIGQSSTEVLYALGVGDHMAGTALWFTEVLPEFKAQNDKVERINDNMPSFESVISKRPELVTTQFEWMIGEQGVVGTRPQFHELGANTFIMPADCEGKNNLVGADGTRTAAFKSELVLKGIEQLGVIFDRQDQAKALVDDFKSREAAAIEQAKGLGLQDATAAVWFSSADLELDPYMAGQKGIPAFLLNSVGIRNVVESDEEWPTVGWETIARANPSVLVLAKMDRRRFTADDIEEKLKFLKSDPVTSEMDAVKNERFIILDAHEMQATIRITTGLEKLTAGLAALPK